MNLLATAGVVLGAVGAPLLLKQIFRIDAVMEATEFAQKNRHPVDPLKRRTLVVTHPNLERAAA